MAVCACIFLHTYTLTHEHTQRERGKYCRVVCSVESWKTNKAEIQSLADPPVKIISASRSKMKCENSKKVENCASWLISYGSPPLFKVTSAAPTQRGQYSQFAPVVFNRVPSVCRSACVRVCAFVCMSASMAALESEFLNQGNFCSGMSSTAQSLR